MRMKVDTVRLHPMNFLRLHDELAEMRILTPDMVVENWVPDPVTNKQLKVEIDPSFSLEAVIVERTL